MDILKFAEYITISILGIWLIISPIVLIYWHNRRVISKISGG